MSLLLRLLLSLTLLANTAAGAWAAPGMAMATVAEMPVATHACHETATEAAAMAASNRDDAHIGKHGAGGHGAGCCAQSGCDCLQHCGTSISLAALVAVTPPASREHAAGALPGRGLPQPYQPVRPPIA